VFVFNFIRLCSCHGPGASLAVQLSFFHSISGIPAASSVKAQVPVFEFPFVGRQRLCFLKCEDGGIGEVNQTRLRLGSFGVCILSSSHDQMDLPYLGNIR
jgi:hypothetical protein